MSNNNENNSQSQDNEMMNLWNQFIRMNPQMTQSFSRPPQITTPNNMHTPQNNSYGFSPSNLKFSHDYSTAPDPIFSQCYLSPQNPNISQGYLSPPNSNPTQSYLSPPNINNTQGYFSSRNPNLSQNLFSSQNHHNSNTNEEDNEQCGKYAFTPQEDEALISSFMRISEDSTVGANQKHEALWKRVKSMYDQARRANPSVIRSRKVSMLDGRFRRISTAVMRWVGFYEQAKRRNGSGQNEENIISEAHKLHTPGKFTLEHAWIMLKGYQKWKNIIRPYVICDTSNRSPQQTFDINESPCDSVGSGGGSGKRIRLNSGDYSTPISVEDESTTIIRPEGSKAAKRNKGKGKANISSQVDVD